MKNQLLPMSRLGQALLLAGLVTVAAPAPPSSTGCAPTR